MPGRHSSKKQNMKSIKTNPKIISPLFLFQDLWKNIINENIILCFLQQEVSSDWKTKGSVWGNISLFMAVWTHSRGRGLCLGSFTINLYISPLRIGMFNVHVPLMGYIVCLMMYGDDIEWREYPHCCSQIPERALTKCPVDPIIVPTQIWFEMNVEFVWSNSKMFYCLFEVFQHAGSWLDNILQPKTDHKSARLWQIGKHLITTNPEHANIW